jgi:hypothetical protein
LPPVSGDAVAGGSKIEGMGDVAAGSSKIIVAKD